MVMVAKELQPTACWEFVGDILVLHHPTTISPKYQAMGKILPYCYVQYVRHVFSIMQFIVVVQDRLPP